MADDLDTLTAQLASLKKAQRSGTLSVRHGDTSVTYRSMAELILAINAVQKEINTLNGVTRKPRYVEQRTRGL